MNERCPLKQVDRNVSPSSVAEVVEISFIPNPEGGAGLRYLECRVCGKTLTVEEDMGYHVPQYSWPERCLVSAEPSDD